MSPDVGFCLLPEFLGPLPRLMPESDRRRSRGVHELGCVLRYRKARYRKAKDSPQNNP